MTSPDSSIPELARRLLARGWTLAVAESCTGGLLATVLTDRPGASKWFDRGIVCYSDAAKQDLLGVPAGVLESHGAVSPETASAMAAGLKSRAGVDWALAVTGIAGPDGGTPDKPVGLVWLGCAGPGEKMTTRELRLDGDRTAIREQAAHAGITVLLEGLGEA